MWVYFLYRCFYRTLNCPGGAYPPVQEKGVFAYDFNSEGFLTLQKLFVFAHEGVVKRYKFAYCSNESFGICSI